MSSLKIPIKLNNGILITGVITLFLLITSMTFLVKSLEKYHKRFILLAIIISNTLPPVIIEVYQKTLAHDIYAISYNSQSGRCEYDTKEDTILQGTCNLTFENRSNKDVEFSIEFYEKYDPEDSDGTVELMNYNVPYKIKVKAKKIKTITINSEVDVSKLKNYIYSGTANGVNIIIKSGNRQRKL
ncbi:hypothetical protein [Peribacillus loiseleuriae]|nr:hypothetical protein [Peribacillus loiseleuriae]